MQTEQTVKWEKPHDIKINIQQPPEDVTDCINAINDVRAPKRASAPQVSPLMYSDDDSDDYV